MRIQFLHDDRHAINVQGIRWVKKQDNTSRSTFYLSVKYKGGGEQVSLDYPAGAERDAMFDRIMAELDRYNPVLGAPG